MAAPLRINLVATLKNEGPYLLEWIAWYRSIGVTDFTLFSNDCTDGTNLMLDRLDAMGEVRHFDNPLGPRMDPQRRAYSRAGKMQAVRDADWVLVVDADEFVTVTVGDGTLAALIEASGDAEAISLGWQPVGSGGAARWVDAPVTMRFTRGGALLPPENKMVPGFKTLFRPKTFDFFGVHRPKFDSKIRSTFPKVRWVNGSGVDIGERVIHGGWRYNPETAGYDHGRVNHYAVKSREEFLLKRLRGSANTKDKDRLNLSYWKTFDLNSTPLPPLRTDAMLGEIERLMSDADLAALRRACIASARRIIDNQLEEAVAQEFVGAQTEIDAPDLPVRAQGSTLQDAKEAAPAGGPGKHRFVVVATMKDEAPYLLEWLAWNRLIGVDHFVILTNDCSDGTDAMLDRLDEMGIVEHVRNDGYGAAPPHFNALRIAWQIDSVRNADWVIHIDADEFLDLAPGDGGLESFLAACDPDGQASAISLVWRYMGSHGRAMPQDLPLTERFLRGSRIVPRETPTCFSFKTMFRPSAVRHMGIHRPNVRPDARGFVWLNGSGQDITDTMLRSAAAAEDTALPPHAVGFEHGSVRHYAVKSRAEFLCKRLRGCAVGSPYRFEDLYYVRRNINTLPFAPLGGEKLRKAIAELEADPRMADLQKAARDGLGARVAELMQTPINRQFIETGRTQAQSEQLPGRLLCVATHHKTGTMWMRYTLRKISNEQGIPMNQFLVPRHMQRVAESGPQIFVNWDADFPRPLFEEADARFIHVIRDPRDVLLSGMRYHRIAPTAREQFLLETRPEWGGYSYQQHLNALPDDMARLLFVMDNKHSETVEQMLAWEYGRPDTIELRYEDLIEDTECKIFRAALEEANIEGLDIDKAVQAFWDNALFGGLADETNRDARIALHIKAGAPAQWKTQMPREVAEAYARRFGEVLRVLGYENDDTWVAQCPPFAEIDARELEH